MNVILLIWGVAAVAFGLFLTLGAPMLSRRSEGSYSSTIFFMPGLFVIAIGGFALYQLISEFYW